MLMFFVIPLFMMSVSADCEPNQTSDNIKILTKTMDIKKTFVDKEGILYVIDFDGKQEIFYNTSTSVVLKLDDLVGENGVRNITLLYVVDSDGNCVLVDVYEKVVLEGFWMIFIGIIIGFLIGLFLSILL